MKICIQHGELPKETGMTPVEDKLAKATEKQGK
jgi:hypothetical protein